MSDACRQEQAAGHRRRGAVDLSDPAGARAMTKEWLRQRDDWVKDDGRTQDGADEAKDDEDDDDDGNHNDLTSLKSPSGSGPNAFTKTFPSGAGGVG